MNWADGYLNELILGLTGGGTAPWPPCLTQRKLRLFGCACARLVWALLGDAGRAAVLVAERFADGEADEKELSSARASAEEADIAHNNAAGHGGVAPHATLLPVFLCEGSLWLEPGRYCRYLGLHGRDREVADLFRDSFEPFGLVDVDAAPRWRTPDVLSLARSAYEVRPDLPCLGCVGRGKRTFSFRRGGPYERDDRVYVVPPPLSEERPCWECGGSGLRHGEIDKTTLLALADALEEAGCGSHDLLAHVRGDHRPRYRGMWGLDLLLGRR